MNKQDLIKKALSAVNCQKIEAQHQLKQAEALHLPELVRHWAQQVDEHKATYAGLLEWLFTLDGGNNEADL